MLEEAQKFYHANADTLFQRYRSLSSEDVFRDVIEHIPRTPCRVADIGSGSGRDTKWLAAMGHNVISVEPTEALRERALLDQMPLNVTYLTTTLPYLNGFHSLSQPFDFILCSAVWMHLNQAERYMALSRIYSLLRSGSDARAIITFKVAPQELGRGMHVLDAELIIKEFEAMPFKFTKTVLRQDLMGRDDTRWYTTVLYKDSIPAQELGDRSS